MDKRRSPSSSQDETGPEVVLRPSRPKPPHLSHRASSSFIPEEIEFMFQPDVSPDLAGMLQKKGRRLKAWKQRYFEIQGANMYYFKNERSRGECLGYIDLTQIYYVGKSTAASFGAPFELQTTGRIHLLAARNDSDRDKWISVIKSKMIDRAKGKSKRGSKADVNAVFQNRDRRATIKYRAGKPPPVPPPPSIGKKLSIPEEPTPIKSSQSFPEFAAKKIEVVQSPSHYDMSLAGQENPPVTSTQKETSLLCPPPPNAVPSVPPQTLPPQPTNEPPPPPILQDIPSPALIDEQVAFECVPPLPVEVAPPMPAAPTNNQPEPTAHPPPNKRASILDDLPSPEDIAMDLSMSLGGVPDNTKRSSILDELPSPEVVVPPPLEDASNDRRRSIIDDLPLPDEIFIPSTVEDLATGKRASILDDLPSPDEIMTPPPTGDVPRSNRSSILDDLPSPHELLINPPLDDFVLVDASPFDFGPLPGSVPSPQPVPPLVDITSTNGAPSQLGGSPSPHAFGVADSDVVSKLRELLNQDDSSWKLPYDGSLLPPMNTEWMQKGSAAEQLRHFLQVCP
ncbi:PREDICTED: cyclin-dependent kinase 12-like isoform X2 [Amphimedon queenslandica]|uniref:PH domain-containing protein n=1 Tax=Amphimedon queenslandica TaxID=400682 RepID=A0AAN0J0U3_AMPQE|nr:PREDICTED: cyclin-dependent kinase 12-like isoform X2 [Amphimedon queenslandica]|eukprot:XP_019850336.1 PREDICTED: cyclin-dependent kinase 12-like isoform X2 [Amphimedon queenslandica]